jgi:hypothetical protein
VSKRIFNLVHSEARRRAVACVAEAPEGHVVEVREPRRSGEQNAALHALLTEIATRCEWAGRRWDLEVWKRLMTAAWCRASGEPVTMLPALDGNGIDIVFRRTSSLTKRECSDLLEFVNAWAAENMPQEVAA